MSSNAVSGREMECIQMFISMFSAIWDQRQMSFILFYGFIPDSFEMKVHAYVYLQLNT